MYGNVPLYLQGTFIMDTYDTDNNLAAETQLRHQAEERVSANEAELNSPLTDEATKRLVHELEVHKIELEMQNEELGRSHDLLELKITERTRELTRANLQLTQEIDERKKAEKSLQVAFAEIKRLNDRLQVENIYLQQDVAREYNFGEIIGQSSALAAVFLQIEQVAPMNATVLLLGETGTGKGAVARAIHSSSVRKTRPMITVNCAALPTNLIESELFGREKGAFTGAHERQIGRFELADGGTIFLDEIGELPLELQSKLHRFIQDGELERLGSPRTIKIDVRIIAATNRDLKEEIRTGRFRKTSITASTFSLSRCRHSGSARKTSRCSSIILWPSSIRKSARKSIQSQRIP